MKPLVLLPPAAALLIVGGWIGAERRSISAMETESAVLRKSIAARESFAAGGDPAGKPPAPEKTVEVDAPIDWKETAALVAEMRTGGMTDVRAMMRLQRRLMEMSGPELAAALDEISQLDLPADSQMILESLLMDPLIQKDPELALDRFVGRIFDERSPIAWQLAGAFQEWAKKDAGAASAWFDKQIAAGTFDSKSLNGRSEPRNQFESKLVSILLAHDPAAAGRRLDALPEDIRSQILRNSFDRNAEESHAAYADFVRAQSENEKESASLLGQQAANFDTKEGFGEVEKFLDRIEARPAERAQSAKQAGSQQIGQIARSRELTTADFEPMREWVATQSPEIVGETTGYALAQSLYRGNKNTFEHAAELAAQFHESSGDDTVLDSFLRTNGNGWQHKEEARTLAGQIHDDAIREKLLNDLK